MNIPAELLALPVQGIKVHRLFAYRTNGDEPRLLVVRYYLLYPLHRADTPATVYVGMSYRRPGFLCATIVRAEQRAGETREQAAERAGTQYLAWLGRGAPDFATEVQTQALPRPTGRPSLPHVDDLTA